MTQKSKLSKPEAVTDPVSGRRVYVGSISSSAGSVLSKSQQKAILSALAQGPVFASALQIDGIAQFNVHQQQGLHVYLQDLGTKGLAFFDQKKGWGLSDTGEKYLKKLKGDSDDE